MSKIIVSNTNTYKNMQYFPLDTNIAFAHILSWFSQRIPSSMEANIIVYANITDQWIQITCEETYLNTTELEQIWTISDNLPKVGFDWKLGAFYIGNYISVETKNEHNAYKTVLNLEKHTPDVELMVYSADKIMRNSRTGLRFNITDLNHQFNEKDIEILYHELQKLLFWKIQDDKHRIYLNIIDRQTIKNYDGTILKTVNGIKESQPVTTNVKDSLLKFNESITIGDKSYNLEGVISNTDFKGIHIANNTCLVQSYFPSWYLEQYAHLCINLKISNLQTDITKTKIILTPIEWRALDTFLLAKVTDFAKPTETAPQNPTEVVTSFESDDETVKLYLTKAFQNTTSQLTRLQDFEIIKDKLKFTYCADDGKNITINLVKNGSAQNDLLQISPIVENELDQIYEYEVIFNTKHPFIVGLAKAKNINLQIDQFAISYVIAETICRLDGSSVMQLKHEINKLLKGN